MKEHADYGKRNHLYSIRWLSDVCSCFRPVLREAILSFVEISVCYVVFS